MGRGCWRNRGRKGLLAETEEKLLFWRFFQIITLTRKETTADPFKNLGDGKERKGTFEEEEGRGSQSRGRKERRWASRGGREAVHQEMSP